METESQLPLAPRDLMVLTVLADGPLHGYGIVKAVEARSRSGVLLDPANLYRTLRRMRRDGWIREVEEEESRRRSFEITAEGREILEAEVDRLERLLGQVRLALAGREGP